MKARNIYEQRLESARAGFMKEGGLSVFDNLPVPTIGLWESIAKGRLDRDDVPAIGKIYVCMTSGYGDFTKEMSERAGRTERGGRDSLSSSYYYYRYIIAVHLDTQLVTSAILNGKDGTYSLRNSRLHCYGNKWRLFPESLRLAPKPKEVPAVATPPVVVPDAPDTNCISAEAILRVINARFNHLEQSIADMLEVAHRAEEAALRTEVAAARIEALFL